MRGRDGNWEGRVAEGRGAEGRGLIAISNYGLDCCLHNPRENHGHSLVNSIIFNEIMFIFNNAFHFAKPPQIIDIMFKCV